MIAAVVFANQEIADLQLVGRIFHIISISGAVVLLISAIGRWSIPYISTVGVLFLLGAVTAQRLPYEVTLNVLFLAAGAIAGQLQRENVKNALLAITLLSGIVMLLQVLGVGEWTQALTTNGILPGGGRVEVPLEPSFLVTARDFQGSYLQGRPSGLFHSNQFACLVVMITMAFFLTTNRVSGLFLGFSLCFVSVLLLSKVVFLGIIGMLIVLFLLGHRRTSVKYFIMMAAAVLLYFVLFPGLLNLFLINPHVMAVSLVVRLVDVAAAIGIDANSSMRFFEHIGLIHAGQMKDALVAQIISGNATSGTSTAVVTLSSHAPVFLSAASALFLAWLVFPDVRRLGLDLRKSTSARNIMILMALATFCLAADFLSAGIFWAFAGFAVPLLSSYSQRETEFLNIPTATKAQAVA